MIKATCIHVKLPSMFDMHSRTQIKEMREWLENRNIKYWNVWSPEDGSRMRPYAFGMRPEDAMIFKMTFGL